MSSMQKLSTRLANSFFAINVIIYFYQLDNDQFLASQSIYAERATCYRPSVTRVDCRKWLKLGSYNFHHRVAQSIEFLWYK